MGIAQALTDVVAAFRGVEVDVNGETYFLRATSDPGDIQTPTVWIPLPDTTFQFNKNRLSLEWVAYLLAPNAGTQRTTTEHLSAMIDAVAGLYPFATGQLYNLTLPSGNNAQAYRLSWTSTITIGSN